MNHLLETTILYAEFQKKVASLLSKDDVASVDRGANDRESLYVFDCIWMEI
jgi:hypothetical protein